MSRYYVQVVGPSGRTTYLLLGREVERLENAKLHPHPSGARRAMMNYAEKKFKGTSTIPVIMDIKDIRDPERVVY